LGRSRSRAPGRKTKSVGDALGGAEVRIEATGETPIEHHSPMEPSAASRQGDRLTLYDAMRWIVASRTWSPRR